MTKLKRQVQMCFLIAAFAALNRPLLKTSPAGSLMIHCTFTWAVGYFFHLFQFWTREGNQRRVTV